MVNQSSRDGAKESEKSFMGALMKSCNAGGKKTEMRGTDNIADREIEDKKKTKKNLEAWPWQEN